MYFYLTYPIEARKINQESITFLQLVTFNILFSQQVTANIETVKTELPTCLEILYPVS